MVITLSRSGGFTGIPRKKTIDTQSLKPEKKRQIEDLLSKTNFFAIEGQAEEKGQTQRSAPTSSPTAPDRFIYTLTIQSDTVSRSILIHEESINPDLQKLIEYLQNI